MGIQDRIRELIKVLVENIHEKRKMILVLSCFVVFITTYMLILPAFTLDKEEASEQGGIDVPGTEQSAEADEADAARADSVSKEDTESDIKDEVKTEEKETETSVEKDTAKPVAQETKKQEAASEAKDKAPSKVTLQNDESDGFVVAVEGEDAGLSEDMSVAVREIDQSDKKQKKEYESLYTDALEAVQKVQKEEGLEKPSDFAFAKFYDISLMDGNDEVEPDSAVDVKISFGKELQKELKVTNPDGVHIVHFAVDKKTGKVTPEVLDADTTDITVKNSKVTEAAFTADSFSVFAVVYSQLTTNVLTADGKTYEIKVTYDDDAEIPDDADLHVHEITEAAKYQEYVAKTQEALGHETDDSNARFFDISIVDKDGKEIQPKAKVLVEIRLLDSEIANGVQVVHFGEKTELMDVKRETDSLNFFTYGFSVFAVVTVESEEGSYVFRGDGYTVKISYTAEAQIPLGTTLTVEELEQGSKQYNQRLGQAWREINREYLEVEEQREHYEECMGDLPDVGLVNLDYIRFFDIRLLHDGKVIEPSVPVQVEISYDDGMKMAGETVSGVVHYTEDDVELIDEVDTVTEGSNVFAFKYEQASFSDTGTYVGQKTYNEVAEPVTLSAPTPMQYPMLQKKTTANALKAAKDGETGEGEEDLNEPIATKTLTPNKSEDKNDGTYTLELAVDGRAKSSTTTEINKSNVLIIMDRSSSMVNNYPSGTINTKEVAKKGNNNRYYSGGNEFVPQPGVRYYGKVRSNGSDRYRELNYTTYTGGSGATHYRWTYVNTDDQQATVTNYTGDNIYTGTYTTRLSEEQEALSILLHDLLAKNGEGTTVDGISLEDLIEISVISFARQRGDKETNATSEVDWSTDYDTLMDGVNSGFAPPGTNWEDALRYAMEVANKKMADPSQSGEDMYIIFLTDGEPTAKTGESSGAVHYGNTGGGYIVAYNAARDYIVNESGLADSDYKFYGIFTWGEGQEMTNYLKRLVNVAHGHTGAAETNYKTEEVDEDGEGDYFYNATSLSKLEEAFNKIFNIISDSAHYEQVSITDGLTTDAMTTTLVNGSAKGFQYTVYRGRVVNADGKVLSKGTPVYTVTAKDNEGGEPTVTFNINGTDYDAGPSKTYNYNEVQEDGTTVPKTKKYYSVTVGSGEDAVEYKMTLADLEGNGKLTWDLAAIGALEDGYTYAVSFTVWPDQDAYDYVAALNNGLKNIKNSHNQTVDVVWDSSVETDANKVTDSNGKSYWKNGVKDYPSIVKYTDGTYAVLTNTDQTLKYTIAKTETVNDETTVTYDGPFTSDLPTPDPMPLTGTASQLEKVWNIDRDPSILYKYLYESKDKEGKPVPFDIGFVIKQDGAEYREVNLPGHTKTDDGFTYDWSAYDQSDLVTHNGKTFSKRWTQDFSISTGLMLSEAQMEAKGLDKDLYPSYFYGGKTYYVLEEGHDFTIAEPSVGYEFDFEAPTYHPMLVDGVLTDVKFSTEGETKRISGMEELDINAGTGKSALSVFNTLRGYINLDKIVVDHNGDPLESDNTEFTFKVELTNDFPVFEGNHIPWYGVEGLYYHDDEGNYYQAEYVDGNLQVKTEEGGPYPATGNAFNPDNAGAQTVTYTVDGKQKSVTISGNQMTPGDGNETDGYKKVTAEVKITQGETLYVANVPVNTQYSIKEITEASPGYDLINIKRKVGSGDAADADDKKTGIIEGEIVPNTETHLFYTNQCLVTDITVKKVDEKGTGLEGAVFQLKTVNGSEEAMAATIASIKGIGDITKVVNGTSTVFPSSFETTGEIQTLSGLPDGTYRLKEVYVPDGYISTYKYIQFTIEKGEMKNVTTDTGDNSKIDTTVNGINLKITNEPGVALPHTGGIGTTIFYVLGSILAIGSAVILISRRRIRKI